MWCIFQAVMLPVLVERNHELLVAVFMKQTARSINVTFSTGIIIVSCAHVPSLGQQNVIPFFHHCLVKELFVAYQQIVASSFALSY